MSLDPSDLIAGGRTRDACVNGLCDKPLQCGDIGTCLDALGPGALVPAQPCKGCGMLIGMRSELCTACGYVQSKIRVLSLRQVLRLWWGSR